MPRKLTDAQRAYLKFRRELTARRRWLWKNKRRIMENGRVKATTRATEVRQDINTYLLDTVRTWPAHFTPEQLDAYLRTLPYRRKGKKRRMRPGLSTHGFFLSRRRSRRRCATPASCLTARWYSIGTSSP